MLPPRPPSPPSGPPRGTYFSRRKDAEPSPPLPAMTSILASSKNFIGRCVEDLPDAVDPFLVLGLHQDGAQARDRIAVARDAGAGEIEEIRRKLGEGEMEVALRRLGEDAARDLRRLRRALRARHPHDDIELGREGREEARIACELRMERERRRAPALEHAC